MKEEKLRQARGYKRRITLIIVAFFIIAITLLTVNVLGDDRDGVDHLIKYTNDEIWGLTYGALGVEPMTAKGEASLAKLSTTLPLGASGKVIETGTKELDRWINQQVEGSYLLDHIGEEDGCEAILVMNLENNEASIISLNATEDFHTFAIEIVKPEPLSAEVHVYEVSLGLSGDQSATPTPATRDAEDQLDEGPTPTPPVEGGEALVKEERGHSGERVDSGQGVPKAPEKAPEKEVSLKDFADLLTVSSEKDSGLESLLAPISQEAVASQASDFQEEALEKSETPKASGTGAAVQEPDTDTTETKALVTQEEEPTPKQEGEVGAPLEDSGEKSLEMPTNPKIEAPTGVAESSTQDRAQAPFVTEEEVDTALPQHTRNEAEEVVDTSPNEDSEVAISEFHSLEMDQPKDGIIVTVPSNGVAITRVRMGERLEPLGEGAFQVSDGDEFRLYSKDASHSTSYITWSKESFNVKYKIEEKTRLILEGGGVGSTTLTLYNPAEVALGQIIANTDSLTIKNAATVTKSGLVKINTIGVANDSYKNGLGGTNALYIENNVTILALSEEVGGSGIFAQRIIDLKPGAVVEGVGETFGVAMGASAEKMSINNAALVGKTQPSRNNKTGTIWAGIYMPAGIISPTGVFNLKGDATAATPVVPIPLADPTIVRTKEIILGEAKSFGIYAKELGTDKVVGVTEKSELSGIGGDVGALLLSEFASRAPANCNFSSSWVGVLVAEGGATFYAGGGTVKASGDGKDAGGVPFGYGVYTRTGILVGKSHNTAFPKPVDRYENTRSTFFEAYGSQVGIYIENSNVVVIDASTLTVRGGVDKNYSSDTPPPFVENTYGLFGKAVGWIDSRYNTSVTVYSGNMGVMAENNAGVTLLARNSAKLKIIASDTAARGNNFTLEIQHGSHLKVVGEYGGLDGLIRSTAHAQGRVFIGGKDPNVGIGSDSVTVVEAIATNTNKLSGSVGICINADMRVYEDAYIFGIGDLTGLTFNNAKISGDSTNNIRMIGIANPYLAYRNAPVRGHTPGAYSAATALIGDWNVGAVSGAQVVEVYNGAQGDYLFFGGDGYRNEYYGGLVGLNKHLTSSRFSMTTYNWTTLDYNMTGENLINNVSYPSASVENMGNHGLQPVRYPHNSAEFEFVRIKQQDRVGFGYVENGVSIRPLFKGDAVTFIADSIGEPIDVEKYEWGDGPGQRSDNPPNIPGVRHSIIFKDVPVENHPKAVIKFNPRYWYNQKDYAFFQDTLKYKVEFDFIPEGGTLADKEHFVISEDMMASFNYLTSGAMVNFRMGEYWLTDKSTYRVAGYGIDSPPPTIHFKLKLQEESDGYTLPYRYPVIEILDGGDEGVDKIARVSEAQLEEPSWAQYGPSLEIPHSSGNKYYDMEPSWYTLDLFVLYQTPRTEVTVRIQDRDDEYQITGKLHIEEYAKNASQTLLNSHTIDVVKNPQAGENVFTVKTDSTYKVWAEATGADAIYLNSSTFSLGGDSYGVNVSGPTSGTPHRVNNFPERKEADLYILPSLPKQNPPVNGVEMFDDSTLGTTPLAGGKYQLSGVRDGTEIVLPPKIYSATNGKLVLPNLKPYYTYTLEQTTPPTGYIQRTEKYQFQIIITQKTDGTFDFTNWTIQVLAPVKEGWIGDKEREITISNAKLQAMDYTVTVETHGLWKPHGEENFFVQLTEAGVADPKVYYRMATFTKGATKEVQIVDCPSFGGNAVGENASQCASTESVSVLFEGVKPGNYSLTLLPSQRFLAKADSVKRAISISQTHSLDTVFANGVEERFFAAGAHQAYEFKLTP